MERTNENELHWLMEWYASQCDGDWEHQHGVTIDTLDNPGWSLKVDLRGTEAEGRKLERERDQAADEDVWSHISSDGETFLAYCGPRELGRVIARFRDWVEARPE